MTILVIVIWIASVAVRLIFINQPYFDHWSWRQTDVAAIARNFLQNGFRFGYPQIDWAGNAPGYVGTEFPILPFIAALCYKFAGVHEWIGRMQGVILFAVSLPFFFLLIRKIFGSTAAVWATLFYGFAPLNIFAGRSFMPDVASLSLAIIGLYFFLLWVEHDRSWSFSIAAVAISLSFLVKITTIIVLAPLVYLAVTGNGDPGGRKGKFVRDRDYQFWLQIVFFTAIALVPSAAWYWHAYQISREYYPHHFFGAGGIRIEPLSWYWHIAQQTLVSSLTPALSVMALVGLFAPQSRDRRCAWVFHWWLAAVIVFVVVLGYGNRHRWYQLPLVPIAAALAGAGCVFVASKISSRVFAMTLSVLLVTSFTTSAFWYVRPLYESSARQLRDAGLKLKKVTPPNSLIVAANMGDPTIFYYAERHGWHFLENAAIYNGNPDDSAQAIENLERLQRDGATHFVLSKNTFWWLKSYPEFVDHLNQHATLIEATPEFRIYKLTLR